MAFFDRISKVVTETGQKTIVKTRELADTSRVNSLISEEEKKLQIYIIKLANCMFLFIGRIMKKNLSE